MRWLDQQDEFKDVSLMARTCVYIDSGREWTALQRYDFDDAGLLSREFADLLQKLMELSWDGFMGYGTRRELYWPAAARSLSCFVTADVNVFCANFPRTQSVFRRIAF